MPEKTVATPACNRADSQAIHHVHHSPKQPPHLEQARLKAPQAHPGPGPKNHTHQLPAQPHLRSPRPPL